MRRVFVVLAAAGALTACGKRAPGTDWPEAERDALVEQCHRTSSDAPWMCDCMFAPQGGVPSRVAWHEYEAWKNSEKLGTTKDPAITHEIAEISARCVAEHAK